MAECFFFMAPAAAASTPGGHVGVPLHLHGVGGLQWGGLWAPFGRGWAWEGDYGGGCSRFRCSSAPSAAARTWCSLGSSCHVGGGGVSSWGCSGHTVALGVELW